MATESLIIEVSEKGARVVKRNLEDIGKGAEKSSSAVASLKRMLGGLAAGAGVAGLAALADQYTNIQNRLGLATTGTENLAAVTDGLFAIANKTRQSFEGTATIYSRVASSAAELGVSQKDLMQFTESLNKAVALSGASAQEAQAGLVQLAQGMASGTLRGEELNAILEQLPFVADTIAKGMGVTRGELRALGADGKITAQQILSAFQEARVELDEKFGKTVPTLGQSFQVLKNRVMEFVGDLDKSLGVTAAASRLILGLSENLRMVAEAAAIAGAAMLYHMAGPRIVAGITAARTAVLALNAAIIANPVGALVTVLLAAAAAVTVLRDKINLGTGSLATLGDLMRAIGESAKRVFGFLAEMARDLLGPVWNDVASFFKNFDFSLAGLMMAAAACVDFIIGGFTGASFAVFAAWDSLPAVFSDLFARAANTAIGHVERLVNKVVGGVNHLREAVGMDAIGTVVLGRVANENENAAREVGGRVADAFAAGFQAAPSAQNQVQAWLNRADEIAKERLAGANDALSGAKTAGRTPTSAEDAKKAKKAADEAARKAKQMAEAFAQLEAQVDPTGAAIKELAANEELLNYAVSKGLVSGERKNELLALMKQQYKDSIDPLGAVNRELEREVSLTQMSSKEAEIANQLESIRQQLLRAGVALDSTQLAQLQQRLVLVQQENALAQVRRQLLDEVQQPAEAYNQKLLALNQLLASGAINGQQFNSMLRDARIEFLESENTFAAGAERAILKLQKQYSDVGSMVEQTITNAFGNAERAIDEFARTGKLNVKDFITSFIADIAKLILRLLILKPLLDSISQYFGMSPQPLNFGGASSASIPMAGGGLPGYANGGVSHGPQLAMVSEGRYRHEAHVPLPDGRSIPVEMNGGSGNLNLTVEIYRGEGDGVRVEEQADAEGKRIQLFLGQVSAEIAQGGTELDKTIRQTYNLHRSPNG